MSLLLYSDTKKKLFKKSKGVEVYYNKKPMYKECITYVCMYVYMYVCIVYTNGVVSVIVVVPVFVASWNVPSVSVSSSFNV